MKINIITLLILHQLCYWLVSTMLRYKINHKVTGVSNNMHCISFIITQPFYQNVYYIPISFKLLMYLNSLFRKHIRLSNLWDEIFRKLHTQDSFRKCSREKQRKKAMPGMFIQNSYQNFKIWIRFIFNGPLPDKHTQMNHPPPLF